MLCQTLRQVPSGEQLIPACCGLGRTDSVIRVLIAYSINTGLLTRYVSDVEGRRYDGDSGSSI